MSGPQASKKLNFKVNEKDYEVIPFVCENHISLFDRIIKKNRVFKSSMIYVYTLYQFVFLFFNQIQPHQGEQGKEELDIASMGLYNRENAVLLDEIIENEERGHELSTCMYLLFIEKC